MDMLRQPSVRALGDGGSVGRGRPRTAALRQKSARVLRDGTSVRRGRPRRLLSTVLGVNADAPFEVFGFSDVDSLLLIY
jgi:hypothetical protein